MNREIKFRVWNLKDKEWDNPAILEVFDRSGKLRPLYNPIENYIIQQFTGLKDKNGKDIYEGDLFRHDKQNSASDNMLFEVKYGKYSCPFGEGYIGDMELGFFGESLDLEYIRSIAESNKLEIVGNIFELPDPA